MNKKLSRRAFLQKGTTAAIGFSIVPNVVMGSGLGHVAPSDKLNIAGVGVGGMGASNLRNLSSQNIVALADVDWKYAKNTFKRYPKAKRYKDYRRMYEEMGKSIDAVVVATADHTHAMIAADAMTMKKHVYVQKPLTHSVYESRLLTKLADKYKIATQMGNQGASGDGVRYTCEAIWSGMIGEVKKVEAFTDRPIWPQGLMTPSKADRIPSTLDWDLFIGPTKERPYNNIYHPWNWRGWWDFGTGALGDMACHILQPVAKALNLKYPISVEGSSTTLLNDCAPNAEVVKYVFPARDNMPKVAMPEVEVTWSDGGILPERPEGLPEGKNLNDHGGCVIFHGTKDTLICGCYGVNPYLLSGRTIPEPKSSRKISLSHEMDWVRACKESSTSRIAPASPFSEAGPLNEMVVMGVLGVRLQNLRRRLLWDGEKMCFTNIGENEEFKIMVEDGFSVKDGHPTFNKRYTDPINAKAFAQELVKHHYRAGWNLVDMPK